MDSLELESELFGSNKHIIYNEIYCIKYMKWMLLKYNPTTELCREISMDSKILSEKLPGFNNVLKKWIVRAISEEISLLNSKIKQVNN